MLYGDNHKKNFVDEPSTKSEPGQQRGEVRMSEDFFTPDAAVTAGEVIKMQRIPAGARIVDVEVFQKSTDGAALGGSVDVGWEASDNKLLSGSQVGVEPEAADPDGFIDGADTSAIARTAMSGVATLTPGYGKKFTADVFLTLTVAIDTTATADASLGVRVFYVED